MTAATQRLPRGSAQCFLATMALLALPALLTAQADTPPMEPPEHWGPISSTLEEVEYPHPVHYMDVRLYGQDLKLAYQDVAPTGPENGRAVMLFHGMNFAGYASGGTIDALAAAGFRVIVPDRIGYGRSSKPDIPYNLSMAATNSRRLLEHLGIGEAAIVGHSMGGMVASRFALLYPDVTTHVVMVNQIGLADQRIGRGWRDFEEVYQGTLNSSYQGILRNHMTYYPTWSNEHLEWVRIQYGMTLTSEWPRLARIRAWQQQILYFDPVVYDWQHIGTKALVIGGAQDGLTARWDELARGVAETLQNAELILYPGIGHNPQFEIPGQFHGDLVEFLLSDPNEPARTGW